MSAHDEDRDLRETFAAIRREEETRAPAIRRLLERGRMKRVRRGRGALVPALLAGIVIALMVGLSQVLQTATPPGGDPGTSLTAWTPPTAFLLRTPGHELLSDAPPIGR